MEEGSGGGLSWINVPKSGGPKPRISAVRQTATTHLDPDHDESWHCRSRFAVDVQNIMRWKNGVTLPIGTMRFWLALNSADS